MQSDNWTFIFTLHTNNTEIYIGHIYLHDPIMAWCEVECLREWLRIFLTRKFEWSIVEVDTGSNLGAKLFGHPGVPGNCSKSGNLPNKMEVATFHIPNHVVMMASLVTNKQTNKVRSEHLQTWRLVFVLMSGDHCGTKPTWLRCYNIAWDYFGYSGNLMKWHRCVYEWKTLRDIRTQHCYHFLKRQLTSKDSPTLQTVLVISLLHTDCRDKLWVWEIQYLTEEE